MENQGFLDEGFRVQGFGFRGLCSVFRASSEGFRVRCFRFSGSGSRASSLGRGESFVSSKDESVLSLWSGLRVWG